MLNKITPVKVLLPENSYNIVIGHQILSKLGEALLPLHIGQDAVVITNPVIRKYHGEALAEGLIKHGFSVKFLEIPSGEKSKSARKAFQLIEQIVQYSVHKRIFIIAFGGGVVGDLAGYVAAAYRRGIPYVQVPTTLLAQIDSAIGGKVGVDLPMGKNLVGAFYQPKLVWTDVSVLSTLSKRQIRNGLAEAVKYGIICDRNLFDYIQTNVDKLLSLNSKTITEIVFQCSRIKAKIVMSDERETKGMRIILNFGHTVGHAIEAANRYKNYHHGEAVALGMRVAADISHRMGLLSEDDFKKIETLISDAGLPRQIEKVSVSGIMEHMAHDKKFKGSQNKFILATRIGSVKVVEGINERTIQAAIRAYIHDNH